MTKPSLSRAAVLCLLPAWSGLAHAQTHAVRNPETVVRAVGVYEWTGEEGKATASRLVPVTVFINGHLEDAGVYLARPVPFALETGTVFEVRKAGVDEGSLQVSYARHRITQGNGAFDDGWLAVGALKLKPAAPVYQAKANSGVIHQVTVNGGTGPHFSSAPAADPDADAKKPAVDRSTAAGAGTTVSAKDDPDQPTLHRKTDSGADSSKADSKDDDSSGVDRPTLKKRTTAEQAHAKAKAKDSAAVLSGGVDLNDDPDRPSLHRGKPADRLEESDLPPLAGAPPNMQQRVAISDAKDRPEHDFARAWESDAEKADVLAKMQEAARAQLKAYGFTDAAPAKATPAKPATPRTAATRHKPAALPVTSPGSTLTNETLKAFTLSYGGAATYVYTAESPGTGGVPRYVTIVAQREPLGTLKVAMTSTTDAAHLDRTPWYRLVDAVDVEASNRASLLFELRAQTTRQFALYRVIGAQADQTFETALAQ